MILGEIVMPVKINTTRSRAKKAMRRKGDTKYRPEQKLSFDIINNSLRTQKIEMEYNPEKIVPLEGTDLTGDRSPRLDIYFQIEMTNYAIRLNGPYHDELKQERKDFVQKTFLEMQPEPWNVIDFNYIKMQNLFKRNKRKLSTSELKLAYNEIKNTMYQNGVHLTTPDDKTWKLLEALHSN